MQSGPQSHGIVPAVQFTKDEKEDESHFRVWQPRGLTRTGSYMQDVWKRIEEGTWEEKAAAQVPLEISKSIVVYDTIQPVSSRCRLPFWLVVACVMNSLLLMETTAAYLLRLPLQKQVRGVVLQQFDDAVKAQGGQMDGMLHNLIQLEYSRVLRQVNEQVQHFMVELPDRAVDGLWNSMRFGYKFGNPPSGRTLAGRREIAYAAWTEVGTMNTRRNELMNRADALWVYFRNHAFSGVCISSIPNIGEEVTQDRLWLEKGPARRFNESSPNIWKISAEGDPHHNSPEAPWATLTHPDFASVHPQWPVNTLRMEGSFYRVQAKLRRDNPTGPAVQAWSGIHDLGGGPAMLSWTSPITPCGNYSCFRGAVAASITLGSVSRWCGAAWMNLQALLRRPPYNFELREGNSAIYVVSQISGSAPEQEGFLLGSYQAQFSDVYRKARMQYLGLASMSSQEVVRETARALLAHHGSWRAESLLSETQPVTMRLGDHRLLGPDVCPHWNQSDSSCLHVATLSVPLDFRTRWLVVMALPANAFSQHVQHTKATVVEEVREAEQGLITVFSKMSVLELVTYIIMALLSVFLSVGFSKVLSHDLRLLSGSMQKLGNFTFSDDGEFDEMLAGRRACIRDVCDLQDAFCRLTRTMKIFTRFVPATVVRNIVAGNARALRLHVSRREVTVMFTDIRDFTSISERLSPHDLLLLLTRYLSVMTRIVESCGGVVTEILGDGMLAFWNTPDDVEDHADKACESVLAQLDALPLLNSELNSMDLPQLSIRIGLHTGNVLSGNLGSETRMKFGCMGDAVDLASRLESLCKHYGVGVLCSGATHGRLTQNHGFVFRRLDVIEVKGNTEPTEIFELLGRNGRDGEDGLSPLRCSRALQYEEALRCFQAQDFHEASAITKKLLREDPKDVAASRLLDKTRRQAEIHQVSVIADEPQVPAIVNSTKVKSIVTESI